MIHDPAWSTLSVVYELLYRFLQGLPPALRGAVHVRGAVDHGLVQLLLRNTGSPDEAERACAKSVLEAVHSRLLPLRAFVRMRVREELLMAMCASPPLPRPPCTHSPPPPSHHVEREHTHEVKELLELVHHVLVEAHEAAPLPPCLRDFLHAVLLPLHRCAHLVRYHDALVLVLRDLVDKDPRCARVGASPPPPTESSERVIAPPSPHLP